MTAPPPLAAHAPRRLAHMLRSTFALLLSLVSSLPAIAREPSGKEVLRARWQVLAEAAVAAHPFRG